jgi:hypothetical protein
MKKFNEHIINESNVSFVQGDKFEAALTEHLKEVAGVSLINISQVRGFSANVYELSVYVSLGERDPVDIQINRFK